VAPSAPGRSGHGLVCRLDARLARITARARCSFDELVATGWAEAPHEIPAPWVDAHVDRLGGWRLAPQVLVDQLAALAEPAPLGLVPRRQVRHLNSQFDDLGEIADVVVHPDDATAAGVVDGAHVVVRSEGGEMVGLAKVDPSVRRRGVGAPRPPARQCQPAH
jgi:anaerobic selenocysteine-containing dehydrogenase